MKTNWLRWISLVGLLGLLGKPLGQPWMVALYGLFGLAVFVVADEREAINTGRAATLTYVVTLLALSAALGMIGVMAGSSPKPPPDILVGTILGIVIAYGLHVITFFGSYIYFERKGS